MGIGAMYGQGANWDTCRPAGFLSKKFTSTQHNYRMHEHETLAVLEALIRWEDKLLGRKFTVITDHKGLEYFKTQPNLSPRQTCWGTYAYMHICTKSIQIYFGIFFDFILVLLSFHCSHTVPNFFRIFPYFSCHFIHFKSLSF